MPTRVITTASSVWTFDLDAKTYTRVPRVEDDVHPNVPYDTEDHDFVEILPYFDRVIVTHPEGVPLYTGTIVSDETTSG